eukprot:881482-Prymnesium_polylepis.1
MGGRNSEGHDGRSAWGTARVMLGARCCVLGCGCGGPWVRWAVGAVGCGVRWAVGAVGRGGRGFACERREETTRRLPSSWSHSVRACSTSRQRTRRSSADAT